MTAEDAKHRPIATLEDLALAGRGDVEAAKRLPMSEWAESRRDLMTPQTIAANHRLHMTRKCPTHGFVWTIVDSTGAHVCQVCGDKTENPEGAELPVTDGDGVTHHPDGTMTINVAPRFGAKDVQEVMDHFEILMKMATDNQHLRYLLILNACALHTLGCMTKEGDTT